MNMKNSGLKMFLKIYMIIIVKIEMSIAINVMINPKKTIQNKLVNL